MVVRWFGCLLILVLSWQAKCQGPPKVTGSYKAVGEMVETLEDNSGLTTQAAFEESFDADTKDAAFSIWVMGFNVTFIENFKTNQTFRYNSTDCVLMTTEEWVKTKSPPSLLAYEDTNGTVRFSLKQLFSLDDKLLTERNVSSEFRGIPARKWMYEVRGTEPDTGDKMILSIYAFWSEQSWSTTSNEASVPLGYIVTKMTYSILKSKRVKVHEQFINVYSFVPGIIDHKLFEPIQGVQCIGRLPTIPFPDVSIMPDLALHSEVVFPDYLEIKYVDIWLDAMNKLFRSDMERIRDEEPETPRKTLKYQSEIAIPKMGVVFKVGYDKEMLTCKVIQFKDFEFDLQSLFNFRLPQDDWKIANIFGLKDTKYVYTGKTSKRGIPCHVFQGLRKDWPYPEAKVTSLWDWCFSVNLTQKDKGVMFRNGEYGLINAQVKVLESGSPMIIPPGFRLVHHFYDITVKDPGLMDATNFDISRCFEEHEKRYLQFTVDYTITKDNLEMVENATSDVTFLQKWKEVIFKYTGLDPHSLRITQVRAVVDEMKLYIKFVMLAPHPNLPQDIKKNEKSSQDADLHFRGNVNSLNVYIYYAPSNAGMMGIKMGAVPNSVDFQISIKFDPFTVPPTSTRPATSPVTFTYKTTTSSGTTATTTSLRTITSASTPLRTETTTSARTTTPVMTTNRRSTTSRRTTSGITDTATTPKDRSSTITPISTTPKDLSSTMTATATTPKDLSSTMTPTVTTPRDEDIQLAGFEGHGTGAVVGVSVAMLLVGISMGSAGVFVKFRGMPSCRANW